MLDDATNRGGILVTVMRVLLVHGISTHRLMKPPTMLRTLL